MSETKRSIFSWFKQPRFLNRQRKISHRDSDPPESKPGNTPEGIPNVQALDPVDNCEDRSQSNENVVSDEFERFVRISKYPTSHWNYDDNHGQDHLKSDAVPQNGPEIRAPESTPSEFDRPTEDLRRVYSMIERRHPNPESSNYRREQARASFRSGRVRDNHPVKKLRSSTNSDMHIENFAVRSSFLHASSGTKEFQHKMSNCEEFSDLELCRVRSFKLTKKGIVNLGDNFMTRSTHTLNTTSGTLSPFHTQKKSRHSSTQLLNRDSKLNILELPNEQMHANNDSKFLDVVHPSGARRAESLCGFKDARYLTNDNDQPFASSSDYQPIRIQIVGTSNVGKTTLCRQLTTSEFLGARMESISEDTVERYVTVELDQRRWNVLLIDNFGEAGVEDTNLVRNLLSEAFTASKDSGHKRKNGKGSHQNMIQLLPTSQSNGCQILLDVLVYLLVYAVDDERSFEYVTRLLDLLAKRDLEKPSIVILVANKLDLVRNRLVSTQRGKRLAKMHGCKYFEISAAINHMVDELLVEIILQVKRLGHRSSRSGPTEQTRTPERFSSFCLSKDAFTRYVRRQFVNTSCENVSIT